MSDENKLFKLIEKIHGEMQKGFKEVNTRLDGVDSRLDGIDARLDGVDSRLDGIDARLDGLDTRLTRVENTVTRIEHDHGRKLDALFDGHKQNADRLDRIENEVSKHQEVILRRIR